MKNEFESKLTAAPKEAGIVTAETAEKRTIARSSLSSTSSLRTDSSSATSARSAGFRSGQPAIWTAIAASTTRDALRCRASAAARSSEAA
eukprot:CAMPEP_0185830158 /NCGR_PEP_ID=MMETSP1353-20130828/659_1 /TAXON_ID=1077150 /ORGANISM="Erythrolobus australicus, Strain CCMP3124" /LENGTH=89 /DNA_ID=CAMNT_0028528019 /DNA_START=80 /DNA_END=350 /DNA_ORIENTATION=+